MRQSLSRLERPADAVSRVLGLSTAAAAAICGTMVKVRLASG
jgi:hypothetical protein